MAAKENRLVTLDAQRGDSISRGGGTVFPSQDDRRTSKQIEPRRPNIGARAIDMPKYTRVR